MGKINIKIDNRPFKVEDNMTILDACRACGYEVPTLCEFNHGECAGGSCRVCLVEVKGYKNLVTSCTTKVEDDMEISISSNRAVLARRANVELLLSNHRINCMECSKTRKCELLHVAHLVGANSKNYEGKKTTPFYDNLSNCLIRDTSKCVLCGRCVARCNNVLGKGAIDFLNNGFDTVVGTFNKESLMNSNCIMCGQCSVVCPTGAIIEKSDIAKIEEALKNKKFVVIATPPSCHVTLGEEFGIKIGTLSTGKMMSAIRRLGFKKAFDYSFANDVMIFEQASLLYNKLRTKQPGPLIVSNSEGIAHYVIKNYPNLVTYLSSCKTPQQIEGKLLKTYYASKNNINPDDMFVVVVTPTTSEKLVFDENKDIDALITVRELALLLKRAGINMSRISEEKSSDVLISDYSGAAAISEVQGGLSEAILRTLYFKMVGQESPKGKLEVVHGLEPFKEATIEIKGVLINVAICATLKDAIPIFNDLMNGKSKYQLIEICEMTGGFVNGGGNPFVKECFLPNEELNICDIYLNKRVQALYKEDELLEVKQAHNNKALQNMYNDFIGSLDSEKAKELFHRIYKKQ